MSDLSTYAGQTQHYAAVRKRLGSPAVFQRPIAERVVRAILPQRVGVVWRVKDAPYGAPFNFLSPPMARNVVLLVALRHGVKFDDVVGPRRDRKTVDIRHEAIKLVYTHCSQLSLPAIGKLFGDRDHTTIHYSLQPRALKQKKIARDSVNRARAKSPRCGADNVLISSRPPNENGGGL